MSGPLWEGKISKLDQVGKRHPGPCHKSSRETLTGQEFGGRGRLEVRESEASPLYPVPLFKGEGTQEAIHSPNPGPKEVGTDSPSLALHHCPWAATLPCILKPCQVDVSISGTSVDTSVGTASRWGGT